MSPQPPAWFSAALAAPADEGDVAVHGARIHYRAWGERGTRGAVLVHGTAAHARWWDHIGPQMSAGLRAAAGGPGQFRTAALDLSGHGDSDWRDRYSLERWAEEVMAVAADAGVSGPPFIIGHSLGGTIAIRAASVYGASLAGIVVVDSPLYEALPEQRYMAIAFRGDRTYPSREQALARFRLVPEHPVLPYVRDHVAAWSVTRRDDGDWGWKFDRSLFASMEPSWPLGRPADCRVAILRTQHGMMTPEMADLLCERLGQVATMVEIPAAGHHVLLDEPLSLVTALRTLLAGWDHPPGPASQSPDTARGAMIP
ncbi:MAG: alpha/beta hydrolase [Streptosporangiaceae bacterium]|nr:alpha/beta hydrolase [Streptosporangiaceae bacterium]